MATPRLSKTQQNAVAQAQALGQPHDLIAASVNLTPQQLAVWTEKSGELAARKRHYEGLLCSTINGHHFQMLEALPRATRNIVAALDSDSESIQLQTSQYVIGRCLPQPTQYVEHHHEGKVSAEVSTELQSAIVHISDTIKELRESHDRSNALSRVREGSDALPSPAAPVLERPGPGETLALPALTRDGPDPESDA